MAINAATFQLVAAVGSLTFVLVTGIESLLGAGPALFLVAAAFSALVGGRAMDRVGRVPVLAAGMGLGIAGGLVTGVGTRATSAPLVVLGFMLLGMASGTVLLSRTAAGDMYPPERRARGIAWVLFGAVFGAILGPAVFSPLFAGKELETDALVLPWFAASGLMAVGLVLVLLVRPDPKRIAALITPQAERTAELPAAPLREILRRPGVPPALLAGLASFGVMVGVMNLTGYVVVQDHGHHQQDVFPIIGAHVLGMYALVLVVGSFVDRLGRTPALVGGLALMGVSCLVLTWGESVAATALLLFGLGLGWNLSFVAASAALVDRATPVERGKLLGFNDLAASLLGASLVLAGGYILEWLGVAALAFAAAAIVTAPAPWIVLRRRLRTGPVATAPDAP
jgi:MFS family permease